MRFCVLRRSSVASRTGFCVTPEVELTSSAAFPTPS